MKKKNIGSSFDSWLREEGIYEEVSAGAIKRVLARQVEAAMEGKTLFEGGDGATDAHQPGGARPFARSRLRRGDVEHAAQSSHGRGP